MYAKHIQWCNLVCLTCFIGCCEWYICLYLWIFYWKEIHSSSSYQFISELLFMSQDPMVIIIFSLKKVGKDLLAAGYWLWFGGLYLPHSLLNSHCLFVQSDWMSIGTWCPHVTLLSILSLKITRFHLSWDHWPLSWDLVAKWPFDHSNFISLH